MGKQLSFSFDIGITSIGIAVAEDKNLKYLGVRMFDQAKESKDSRLARSARRNTKRKQWRKKQLRNAFADFGLLSEEELKTPNFGSFTAKSDAFPTPKDRTVYHLRKRALSEQITLRELYLCLLNMLHARGHFNMEMYDFTKETITYEEFADKFYSACEPYFQVKETEKKAFEDEYLKVLFKESVPATLIRKVSKEAYVPEEQNDAFIEILSLLAGKKAKLNKVDPDLNLTKDSYNMNDLKASEEELDDFLLECIDLFDMAKIAQILSKYSFLCEKAVAELDEYERIITTYGKDSKEYAEKVKEIKGISKGSHPRAWRNIENNYPNGLYVKEASAILNQQQNYYPQLITSDFIEAVIAIIKARIPYYIGPLSNTGKNAWISRNDAIPFKYSYEYTQKHSNGTAVNEPISIKAWKERMISHCTYLPEEYALPKGSFLGETFNILNELNILSAYSNTGDSYYLTLDDKTKVFDTLFLKNKSVKYKDVAELLDLKSYGPVKSGTKEPVFNNTYTLYLSIAKIIPELKLNSIMDVFDEPDKIQKIEDIILAANLYDEEKSKIDYFTNEMSYSKDIAAKLAKLKSTSFYSFSKKFIYEQPIDGAHGTLLSKLFEDNTSKYTNEQMPLITMAIDSDGKPLNFIANKYIQKLKTTNGELSIDLLLDNGKPVIPTSRPVIRALNECMKVYSELVNVYGVPDRVIIETARDFKDFNENKTITESHFKSMEKLYDKLMSDIKENHLYDGKKNIEGWDEIKQYLEKNKTKIELYIRQNGTDLLTGEKIDIHRLNDYEIDHILPRGFGDDSKDDKMLISRLANAKKGDRLPLQFIESGEMIGTLKTTSSEYEKRVKSLFDCKLISEQKFKRLMLATTSELEGFINQNLVDTRYIIREFMSILRAYSTVHKYSTHIVALKSAYTKTYRRAFNMDKERDFGDQHHAHDAAILLIADKTLSAMYPHYDERKSSKGKNSSFKSYEDFMKDMNDAHGNDDKAREKAKELNTFIRNAYYKAFGEDYKSPNSFLSQVKATVPFYSKKVEKNYKGKFFEATVLPHKQFSEDAPLTIVGVNDDTKIFSGVECAAVDFYKFTNSKGKKEHLAIHIPKVIISSDGVIDQDKYIALILKHYKKPELIDENGNLKTYYFRFRAFRNDIIYDTAANTPTLFNIGSIVNKKLEKKFINVFSYNDIYTRSHYIAECLTKQFNLKTRSNKSGNNFSDISNSSMVQYTYKHIWHNETISDAHVQNITKYVDKVKNVYELADLLSYYELLLSRPDVPPTVTGRNLPVANYASISKQFDAQYVKLKYNILGVRFHQNENGKLIIETPKEIRGQFTKITKEEFSWNISKSLL